MRELHAWENGHHVGVFSEDDEERISFAYDANEGLPISLSLPRTGGWRDQAPRNFLDNLLPDNPNVRQAMREHLNASSAGVFDLLDRVDATGGLVFSLSPEPPIPSPTLRLISDSQIANEIDRIERTRNYWWDEDSHCRFSLGGAQGKFTLSRVDGKWYWPDMMLPSTHIVKPKPHDLPEATKVELATMRLSELCGIDTPARGEITAQRKTAYIVERFDRRLEEGRIVRLRQEDFLQALGLPTRDKYDPSADDCLDFLQRIDASGSLSYRWLERLAFNTSSANSDAHAKNYSLILDPASGIRLSPQYDAVATRYWPEFNWELTMPLNEDHAFAEHTTPQDWEDLGDTSRSRWFEGGGYGPAYGGEGPRRHIRILRGPGRADGRSPERVLDEGERVHRADHAGRRAGELSRSSIGFARFARFSLLGPYHLSFFREAS